MELDPFLITAQIINFLILVWLLNRFLFAPVTRVMDERAARVQAELDEARKAREEAAQREDEVAKRLAGLAVERDAVLASARTEAEKHKSALMQDVREQIEQLRVHWRDGVQREQDAFIERLQERVLDHTQRAMRKALADLADADLDARVVQGFLDRLDALREDEWAQLTDVAVAPDRRKKTGKKGKKAKTKPADADAADAEEPPRHPVFDVSSARELPSGARERITNAVRERVADAEVRFHHEPAITCGVELRGPGRRLAWSLSDYLESLRVSVQQVFEQLGGGGRA